MSEAKHRAATLALYRKRKPNAVVFRHEDMFRAGVPDTSISQKGITSWWEFKHATPVVKWRGAQAAEMRRLWSCGIPAYYVIFLEKQNEKWTLIVPATEHYAELKTDHYAPNINYRFVIQSIESVHAGGVLR